MGRKNQSHINAAARARAARHVPREIVPDQSDLIAATEITIATRIRGDRLPPRFSAWDDDSDDDYDCGYDGGVNTYFSDDEYDPEGDADSDFMDLELSDFDEEILETLKAELASLAKPGTVFEALGKSTSKKDWKKAEANRSLRYSGNSERTRSRQAKQACERQTQREEFQKS
jgi:hypothetical protein